jgi:hypothetical protein
VPDPIESQRRRRRIAKRGSAREFFCELMQEHVLIAIRRRTGSVRWQDSFVWCSQDECQYSGSNAPPCPLHPGMLNAVPAEAAPLRCARCDLPLATEAASAVVFDNRLQHAECPYPVCGTCARAIRPDDDVEGTGPALAHRHCAHRRPPPISGGVTVLPWTAVFDARLAARAHVEPRVLDEFLAMTREACSLARDTRARARLARARTTRLLAARHEHAEKRMAA